jgi:hypothetical protein
MPVVVLPADSGPLALQAVTIHPSAWIAGLAPARGSQPTTLPAGEYFQMVMQAVRTRAQLVRTELRENRL